MSDIPTPINNFVAEIRNGIAMAPKRDPEKPAVSYIFRLLTRHPEGEELRVEHHDRAKVLDLADQLAGIDYGFVSLVREPL